MKRRDLIDLLLLAAVWGGSFLFMRIAVPEFGPMPMVEMRVAIAALVLVPLLLRQQSSKVLGDNWRGLTLVGITNSAIPFALFAFAMVSITSGMGRRLIRRRPRGSRQSRSALAAPASPTSCISGLFATSARRGRSR